MTRFVRRVLADTEDVWERVFQAAGKRYEKPTLVLFSGATQTACGIGQSAMGPFYCPLDKKVYIDLDFYRVLKERFHAPGDFAQAYVIAHEIGHHVQTLLGVSDKVQALKQQAMRGGDEPRANALPGAHGAAGRLPGRRVGEPQRPGEEPPAAGRRRGGPQRRGPDRRRHAAEAHAGPAWCRSPSPTAPRQQRVRWFKKGLEAGRMQACDTFDGKEL